MDKLPKTIDEYIKTFPENIQVILKQVRKAVSEAAPKAPETISYQMPAFELNGKNLVFFAAFKHHIGFYPLPGAIKSMEKELSGYKTSKGAIQFPLDRPMPVELIKKIVRFRIKEDRKLI